MALVNIIDKQTVWRRWGNVKSYFSKKATGDIKNGLKLKIYNPYTQIVYREDELPDSLKEMLEEFPEAKDLKYEIIGQDKVISEGFFKEYKDVSEVEKSKASIQNPLPSSVTTSEQSVPITKSINNDSSSNEVIYSLDVNQLFSTFVETTTKIMENTRKIEPTLIAKENPTNLNQIKELKENHELYIDRLIKTHEEEKKRLQDLNEKTNTELKSIRSDLNKCEKELFDARLEIGKLKIFLEYAQNTESSEAKFEKYVSDYARQQKKMDDALALKRDEFNKLQAEVMEKRIKVAVEDHEIENESELSKALKDTFVEKLPTIIDRGLDFLASRKSFSPVTNYSPTPII
ncbi:MAG: hypothetical protein IPO06_04830 [Leptospiraceae bacterium]|nr:hypothetical protein [Leptospiraceae bacterium]